ncbi:Oxidoreductase molybdopterin binding domain protein [Pseudooceanicola marinus]|uniref:Oxidoreductase molybdopterin binding domain protein n=1 Tax=Pseudooceanicola marinus TaxID=396013 RepID=A0A1X6YLW8_9RHOB|nr:molybdopterin-dependent oxidoreductase [Pseudooceanicola marinus]PJE29336.1 oxidoreductase [Pseudooceanicola marinus]SLN24627.1 Oxidoreductase molybdopterin binding domain protein [Pseudooceanicola marinus]
MPLSPALSPLPFLRHILATLFLGLSALLAALPPNGATAQDAPLLRLTLGDEVITYDLAALQDMPATVFETTTIWTEGVQAFRGIRMTDFLARHGIEGGVVQLIAANDYAIEIPVDSFRPDGAILAYERNGRPMTLRSKGPLWLVYPYDSSSDFRSEVIYSNSIWQLDRIIVK